MSAAAGKRGAPGGRSYRLQVASRVAAAVVGGYALAALATAVLALLLPRCGALSHTDAVLTSSLASFALYAGAVLWVFSARSAARAWLGLALPALALGSTLLLLRLAAAPAL